METTNPNGGGEHIPEGGEYCIEFMRNGAPPRYLSEEPFPKSTFCNPILVFDGDGEFCRAWSRRIARWTCGAVECATCTQAVDRYPQLADRTFEAVWLLDTDGQQRKDELRPFRASLTLALSLCVRSRVRELCRGGPWCPPLS